MLSYISEQYGNLDYMVGHAIGTDIFYLSENIKVEYRNFVMYHEYFEFKILPSTSQRKCPTAIKTELELIPAKILADYISFRHSQFKNLHEFHKEIESPVGFLDELQESINILYKEVKSCD